MKKLIFCGLLLGCMAYAEAQTVGGMIKKVKSSLKSGTGSSTGSQSGNGKQDGSESKGSPDKDSGNDQAPGAGQDSKASYETIHKGDANCKSSLIYNESRLGVGANGNGYSLVVKKQCGGKDSYIVIENGQQTGNYDKPTAIPMPEDLLSKSGENNDGSKNEKNYIKESGGNKSVVVGGKNYGSYAEVREVFVTPDKKTVFHDWLGTDGRSGISFNGKKTDLTPIDEMENFIDHKLIKSHDKNTLAFLCLGTPNGSEKQTIPAILVKADGTKKAIKVSNIDAFDPRVITISSGKELCWLDTETWDLYTEGRKVGSFKKNKNVGPSDLSIIAGADLNKAVLYDRMGNLYFLDGHVEKAGAVYPFITTANGRQYISWLKQEGENILKGSIELK